MAWGNSTIPSPPKTNEIKNPGGVKAPPSGPSVAANMVKNARGGSRGQPSRVPKPPGSNRTSMPKAPSAPYNPLNSPYANQGQFNAAVAADAKSQYQPELDSLNSEEASEQDLHSQRQVNNVADYQQYSQQAQEAYKQAQGSMAQIAARQNSSTAAGQQALQAALSNTGVSGLSSVPNQDQFMNEAAGLGNAGSQTIAGEQLGITGEMAKDLNIPGAGLAEATGTEASRSSGILGKIGEARQKVLSNVPGVITKTRTELQKQEQDRQANKLQAQLANKKLGFEEGAKLEVSKEKNQFVREAAKEKNEAFEAIKRQEVGIKEEAVQNQKRAIDAKIAEAKTKHEQAIAVLEGKRYDNGLKIMTSYFKGIKTNAWPKGAHPTPEEAAKNKWTHEERADARQLYNQLTQQAHLTAPEAFHIMQTSGNGYVELFAREHEAIYNRTNQSRNETQQIAAKIKAKPLQPLH